MVFLGCGAATAAHSRTLARRRAPVRRFYASRSAQRAAAFERRFRGSGSYGSYEAALQDGRSGVAFVATPPSSHLALTLAALREGKHVIVEKPAFLQIADFDAVAAAARAAGRRVLVAENYAYKPLARTLQGLLGAGAIGELRFVQVNAAKQQDAGDGWRADAEAAGGGALFEGGIHWIDLLAHLGPKVCGARGFRAGDPGGPERSTVVVLDYAGGAVGTLLHSWEIPSPLRGLRLSRIYGTAGAIAFESNGLFVAESGRRTRVLLPGLSDLAGYAAMFDDFLEALATGREPLMTLARARWDTELVRAACAGH
ncbi:MAG: Gfo/Idh/MocA family oxidoreductase [Vicinamibacteria bacterium]